MVTAHTPVRLLVASLCAAAVVAQEETRARAGADPYTGGDAAALEKAGYVSLGPFPFGSGHTTTTVEELLGAEPLVWIETAHFRLGCALSPLRLRGTDKEGKEWVKRVQGELDELRVRIPTIKKRVKELDPWLRAHLTAHRLEKLYSDVLRGLGRDDAWFEGSRDASDADGFTGVGRYMGLPEKFTVLLLQKGSSHARYTRAYQGREMEQPTRWYDTGFGSLYWGASEETAEGLFKNDMALQSHLMFNVAHNLYTGYRGFSHDLPAWVATGVGHHHSRLVSPRYPTYDREHDTAKKNHSAFWEWDEIVRGLAKNDAFLPLSELMALESAGAYDLENHMQAWSTMEFLLTQRPEQARAFLHALKAPFHARHRQPTTDELKVRQEKALRDAFGCDEAALEAQWKDYLGKKRGR